MTLTQDIDKIKPYIVDSPERLQQANTSLGSSVSHNKQQVANLERRIRALKTSAESYHIISEDVNASLAVMEQCQNDLMEEEKESGKAQRYRDQLAQKRSEAEAMDKQEMSLRARLAAAKEKVEAIQKTSAERAKARKDEIKAMEKKYEDLARDRDVKNDSLNQKKAKIERTQKWVCGKSCVTFMLL